MLNHQLIERLSNSIIMKQLYAILFLILCLSTSLNSQNFRGNWNVLSLESNGNSITLPSTVTTPPNINFSIGYIDPPIGYEQYSVGQLTGNVICNSFTTYYEGATSGISPIPYFETSSNACNTTEEADFENLFFAILQQPGTLNYSFSNNLYNLSFTNSLGEIIHLGRENTSTNPLSGEWFLHFIWDYDILFENTFDPSLNIIFTVENTNGHRSFYGASTCNGFNGSYDNPIQTSSFIMRNMGWTLVDCFPHDALSFENAYVSFFGDLDENIFNYEVTGSGSEATLVIQNGYGADITYGRQALSVEKLSQPKSQLINMLSENKLKLISPTIYDDIPYTIYDISGRKITAGFIESSHYISINTLKSGVYILDIKNSLNQSERFKFVKK
jgi:heat shock protein HslJ